MSKKGLLVANGFLHSGKFNEHYAWLKEAAKNRDCLLDLYYNDEIISGYENHQMLLSMDNSLEQYDFILFWDKDIPMGRMLEHLARKNNIPTYNSIDSIQCCDDKSATYYKIALWNEEHDSKDKIPLVDSLVAPMTYANIGYTEQKFLDMVEQRFSYPVVLKECFGSFGWQVYLVNNREELSEKVVELAGKPFLFQRFVQESTGRDVRLQVVGEQVVAAMYRFSENGDFRANISSGGNMKPYTPSENECALAVRVTKALGLDFAGVDLLFSHGDAEADVVCEVNSNAHFKNIFTCTGVNVADKIMEYILSDTKRGIIEKFE